MASKGRKGTPDGHPDQPEEHLAGAEAPPGPAGDAQDQAGGYQGQGGLEGYATETGYSAQDGYEAAPEGYPDDEGTYPDDEGTYPPEPDDYYPVPDYTGPLYSEYGQPGYGDPGYPVRGYTRPEYAAQQYAGPGYPAGAQGRTWDEGTTANGGRGGRHRSGRANGPWPELVIITAVAIIAAAVVLALTSANHNSQSATQGPLTNSSAQSGSGPRPRRGPSSTLAPTSTRPSTTVSQTTPTTVPPASRATAENLVITASVKASLVKSWLATDPGGAGMVAKDVAGTVPGQVYYASQPATGVYWAIAAFAPSATVLRSPRLRRGRKNWLSSKTAITSFRGSRGRCGLFSARPPSVLAPAPGYPSPSCQCGACAGCPGPEEPTRN